MLSGFCNWRRNNHPKPFKPAGVVVYLSLTSAALWGQEASFHTTATYVLIDASVTTSKGVPVAGLTPENFEIRENGQSQDILRFDSGSASVAMIVAADFSGSMKPRQSGVASGVGTLATLLQPDDEAGLLLFNEYILPVELDPTAWRTDLLARVPTGQTAIYDAVNRGLEQLAESTHQRRVLIVLSDGADTASRTKRDELFETLRATGALVYCVGLFKPGERGTDAGLLRDIAERSGGLAYFEEQAADLTPVFESIMRDLRSRYVLMFRAESATEGEAEVRRISVTAKDAEGKKLRIRARREYTIDNQ